MCRLRAGIVTNCGKCKSSIRVHCPIRKKTARKTYVDNRKKGDYALVKIGNHAKCPQCSRIAHVIWISQDGKLAGIRCSGYHSQLSHGFSKFGSTAHPRKPQKNMVFLVEI